MMEGSHFSATSPFTEVDEFIKFNRAIEAEERARLDNMSIKSRLDSLHALKKQNVPLSLDESRLNAFAKQFEEDAQTACDFMLCNHYNDSESPKAHVINDFLESQYTDATSNDAQANISHNTAAFHNAIRSHGQQYAGTALTLEQLVALEKIVSLVRAIQSEELKLKTLEAVEPKQTREFVANLNEKVPGTGVGCRSLFPKSVARIYEVRIGILVGTIAACIMLATSIGIAGSIATGNASLLPQSMRNPFFGIVLPTMLGAIVITLVLAGIFAICSDRRIILELDLNANANKSQIVPKIAAITDACNILSKSTPNLALEELEVALLNQLSDYFNKDSNPGETQFARSTPLNDLALYDSRKYIESCNTLASSSKTKIRTVGILPQTDECKLKMVLSIGQGTTTRAACHALAHRAFMKSDERPNSTVHTFVYHPSAINLPRVTIKGTIAGEILELVNNVIKEHANSLQTSSVHPLTVNNALASPAFQQTTCCARQ